MRNKMMLSVLALITVTIVIGCGSTSTATAVGGSASANCDPPTTDGGVVIRQGETVTVTNGGATATAQGGRVECPK